MLIILLVLVLAWLVWIVLKPAWLPKPPENRVTTAIADGTSTTVSTAKTFGKTAAAKTGNWLSRAKSPFQKHYESGKQLKAWAAEAELAKKTAQDKTLPEESVGLTTWLAGLSDEQAAHFANELAAFCRSQNLALAWLFDAKTSDEIKDILESVVILYSLAIWKGRKAQPIAAFHAWQTAPKKEENRIFARKLYIKIVEAGMANSPAEMFLASEKEREAHILKAIQDAANQNRAAVLALAAEAYATGETAHHEKKTAVKKTRKPTDSPKQTPAVQAAEVTV